MSEIKHINILTLLAVWYLFSLLQIKYCVYFLYVLCLSCISGVIGGPWDVSYAFSFCALNGSSVTIPCTYKYPQNKLWNKYAGTKKKIQTWVKANILKTEFSILGIQRITAHWELMVWQRVTPKKNISSGLKQIKIDMLGQLLLWKSQVTYILSSFEGLCRFSFYEKCWKTLFCCIPIWQCHVTFHYIWIRVESFFHMKIL